MDKMFKDEVKKVADRFGYDLIEKEDQIILRKEIPYVPTKEWQLRCPKCGHVFANIPGNWNRWITCDCGNDMFISYPPDHPKYAEWKKEYDNSPSEKRWKKMTEMFNDMDEKMMKRAKEIDELEEKFNANKI